MEENRLESIDEYFGKKKGIFGPMASDKTTDFIVLINKYKHLQDKKGHEVVVVKSDLDVRLFFPGEDPRTVLQARSGLSIDGVIPIDSQQSTYDQLKHQLELAQQRAQEKYGNSKVVFGIPEAQFLDSGLVRFAEELSDDVFLLWEGLDRSFRGEYFPLTDNRASIRDLINLTDFQQHNRTNAICDYEKCNRFAPYSQRMAEDMPEHWSEEVIVVGARQYEARCTEHHKVPGKELAYNFAKEVKAAGKVPLENLTDFYHQLGGEHEELTRIQNAFIREKQMKLEGGFLVYGGS